MAHYEAFSRAFCPRCNLALKIFRVLICTRWTIHPSVWVVSRRTRAASASLKQIAAGLKPGDLGNRRQQLAKFQKDEITSSGTDRLHLICQYQALTRLHDPVPILFPPQADSA